jgi:copper chaperone NosL
MSNHMELPNPQGEEVKSLESHGKVSRGAQAAQVTLLLVAAALLIGSLKLPLWQIRLEAPQYRGEEALRVAVHPNAMRGDLKELTTLNKYIGVHVPPTLPQFKWLPGAILSAAILGLITCGVGRAIRSAARFIIPAALAVALGVAAVQANKQMRDIGHHRDHKTPLVGVQDFTPPFLGKTKIAQFEVTSTLGLGAWLIGAAMALQTTTAFLGRRRTFRSKPPVRKNSGNTVAQFKPAPVLHSL